MTVINTAADQSPRHSQQDNGTKDEISIDGVVTKKLGGYDFYRQVLKSPKYVVAPMVDQSELAWRILSRRYGAHLCYTPMFHARLFADPNNSTYRNEMWEDGGELDRPLIVQFCANEPEHLLAAAKLVEGKADAVDLNLGCPQHIAKRGHYGSFLMEDWDLIYKLIRTLHDNLNIPVTAKIRVYPEVEKTVQYAKMVESAGAQIITVHGRLREQKGHKTGLCDWNKIRAVKEAVRVPVFANGNILYFEDVQRCIDATGVDGVMSAETNLYNPALFSGKVLPVWQLADEYLEICREVPTKINYIRAHLFKLYRQCLPQHTDIREQLAKARDLAEMSELAQTLKQRLEEQAKITEYDPSRIVVDEYGYRVYPPYICQPAIRRVFDKHNSTGEAPLGRQVYEENAVRLRDLECAQSLVATGGPSIPQQQQPDAKSEKRPNSSDNSEEGTANTSKKPKADKAKALKKKSACLLCHNNASAKCPRLLCKNCCREISQKLANHNAAELPTLPENNTRQVPFDWTSAAIPADCEAHGSRKTGASCFSESTPA